MVIPQGARYQNRRCCSRIHSELDQRRHASHGGWAVASCLSPPCRQDQCAAGNQDAHQAPVSTASPVFPLERAAANFPISRHNSFERTSCAQKQGFKNREKWEQDLDGATKDPFATAKSVGRWLYEHDAEQYVYDNWQACLNHMCSGATFKNTNIPPGYEYEPWTMESLMKTVENGQTAVDAGDWD
jgi:hypothetical protein